VFLRRQRRGQSTVEYILFISVIVIAIAWIAGDGFWPAYSQGLQSMQDSLEDMTSDGVVDGR
jgi:hypothetical protein